MTDAPQLAGAAWLTAAATGRVLDALEAGGGPVRFVGGCVRDTLVDPQQDQVDLDLATASPPERNLELLAAAGIRTLPTGLAHGTITAQCGERAYEITTLRRDTATDGRRAKVEFTDCFVADAARRDFTFNAMSCDRAGRLFDPFGGRADLAAGIVRFVGDPVARIREDYLRILRFFRFQARLGRAAPPPAVRVALAAEKAGLDRLSGERVQTEILKTLAAPGAVAVLRLMSELGIWQQVFGATADTTRLAGLLALPVATDPISRLAAALKGGSDARAVAARLRLSGRDARRLEELVTAAPVPLDLDPATLRRFAYRLGPDRLRDRLVLSAAVAGGDGDVLPRALAVVEGFVRPRLPVDGRDLLARGLAGPAVGAALAALEAAWVESDFTLSRAVLLARLDARLADAVAAPSSSQGRNGVGERD